MNPHECGSALVYERSLHDSSPLRLATAPAGTCILPALYICEREYCTTFLTVRGQYRPQCMMHPAYSNIFVHVVTSLEGSCSKTTHQAGTLGSTTTACQGICASKCSCDVNGKRGTPHVCCQSTFFKLAQGYHKASAHPLTH
jgi:hypothetical protein